MARTTSPNEIRPTVGYKNIYFEILHKPKTNDGGYDYLKDKFMSETESKKVTFFHP